MPLITDTAQDVIQIDDRQPYRKPAVSQWEQSLRRLARAQAICWHETPMSTRLAILARVDREQAPKKGPGNEPQ